MTELLAQILDLPMLNNGFCNTISYQMACVNMEFYHINLKKNNNAYLQRTEKLQYASNKLLFFEQLKTSYNKSKISNTALINLGKDLDHLFPSVITEYIALTLYCFTNYDTKWTYYDTKWNDNNNIISFTKDYVKMFYLKENDFHKDFVFDFSLDLWKKFKSYLISESSASMNIFIFSLSSSFRMNYDSYKTKHIVAKIFISIRWFLYISKGTEYIQGQKCIRELLKYMKKNMFIQDYDILLTTKPTMLELNQFSNNNIYKEYERGEYFKLFMLTQCSPYFVQQLIFDIIQNSLFVKNISMDLWIRGFLSVLVD